MTLSAPRRIAALLFCSGLCAIAYQTAWLRLLRLIFGASTAASAAVIAVFMLGLGLGSLWLGKRADRAANPLAFYARLEIAIAALAALSPWLVAGARAIYVELGGTLALGSFWGTALRLLLSAAILGPPTFLMGGTMPAAIRAAEDAEDRGRRTLGLLYGANTLGAVSGALLVTFYAVEFLGTRKSILAAAALNLVVGLAALALSRRQAPVPEVEASEAIEPAAADPAAGTLRRLALPAAAVVGFVFFLMELVWYRMLSPLLGGSSYTFGLILAVALLGIGAGGLLYGLGARTRRPTIAGFAATCALEALAIAVPFALGDRLAFVALVLRGFGGGGFGALVMGWAVMAGLVVLPAAIVAGYQFPLLVGILGAGRRHVGREVGLAYGWNTAGSIAGALAGGFGLLPLLGAPLAWRLSAAALVLAALAATIASRRRERSRLGLPLAVAAAALLALAAPGPTAAWRHSGIGAGRFRGDWASPNQTRASFQAARAAVVWEAEGTESSVALWGDGDYAFFINGKSDGAARGDAATQVMSGLVGALLHPEPRRAMVIGLGTGSTAGWLAEVPGMERVDVAEIEPAIVEVARACAAVNRDCLRNPRLRILMGDARELLLTSQETYDLLFSEPSNPYRAGISSLFTQEFYRAAAQRLAPGGIFLQWVQGYEVDAGVVRTAFATLASVFPHVETWQIHHHDLLLVAAGQPIVHDISRLRQRAESAPFDDALQSVWGVAGVEGLYSGYLASPDLAVRLRESAGDELSTDDLPRIEFGFIRNLGRTGLFDIDMLRREAGQPRPATVGDDLDWRRVTEAQGMRALLIDAPPAALDSTPEAALRSRARIAFRAGDVQRALALWRQQPEEPATRSDLLLVAGVAAATGDESAPAYIDRLRALQPTEALALEATWHAQRSDPAAATRALFAALRGYRTDPWPHPPVMRAALALARRLAEAADENGVRLLLAELAEPFAVHLLDRERQLLRIELAARLPETAPCLEALAPFAATPLWQREVLEARARCTARTEPGGRRARQAARDLRDFLAAEPRPLETP